MPRHLPLPAFACLSLLSLAAMGCGPTTMADCEQMADPSQRETCRGKVLALIADDPELMLTAIEQCSDPLTRDLLRLELIADNPRRSIKLCPQMEGEQAKTWCEKIEGRAHLWRTDDGQEPTTP